MILTQFTDNLWRGSHPQSQADVDTIRSKGIKTILNLQIDSEAVYPGDILVLHYPCSNFFPPQDFIVDRVLKDMLNPNLFPAVVHCRQGKDRTGYVVAAYRCKVQGWDFAKAYQEMLDNGYHWLRYSFFHWKQSLERYVGK